ncbi:MAG: hypothetical protein ACOC7N_04995 [Chloroflexota bacterium]
MDKSSYKGWQRCYRLANDLVDLVVTAHVGPRIIRFGFVDGENQFWQDPDLLGCTGGEGWVNYGGHRLWHAPEARPRTYAPDNDPVQVDDRDGTAHFVQPVEPNTGIQKTMEVHLHPDAARVDVTHRLRNTNLWPVTLAPWAISVMAPGGTGILPLPPRGAHPQNLQPNTRLSLWAYTDMQDPRWTWGTRFVLLRQDPRAATAQKAGTYAPQGWAAYARAGTLFVTTVTPVPGADYPDLGVNVELFTNSDMLEVETLGPLVKLEPGGDVSHVETWHLFDGLPRPETDEDVVAHVEPLVAPLVAGHSSV